MHVIFAAGRAALEAGRHAEAAGTLRTALSLWRSGVLADLADYAFTRPEAARLEELRLAAAEARIDADLALGRHDALTAELEQLATEHPLRERLHGQLMLALYRAAGRPTRWPPTDGSATCWPVSSASTRASRCGGCTPRCSPRTLRWTGTVTARPRSRVRALAPTPGPPRLLPPGESSRSSAVSPRPSGAGRARSARPRLLVVGSALAVAAAVCVVAVIRPWAGGPSGLPADSVGLIGPSGELAGAPASVASPAGLAYGDGTVWAVDSADGTLWRIDPATHAVVQQIPVGSAPSAVAITGQDVWVTNSGDGTVSRVSAAAGRAVEKIPVGNIPVAIAAGEGRRVGGQRG